TVTCRRSDWSSSRIGGTITSGGYGTMIMSRTGNSDSHLLHLDMASQVRQSSVVDRFFRSNSRSTGPHRASGGSCRVFTTARCHRQFAPEVTVRVLAEPDGANRHERIGFALETTGSRPSQAAGGSAF